MRKALRGGRGSVLVEFALTFPVLMALFLGFCNVVLLLAAKIEAGHAAAEAARVASITGSEWQARQAALARLEQYGQRPEEATVDVSMSQGWATAQVRIRAPIIAPGFAALLGGKPWDKHLEVGERRTAPVTDQLVYKG